MGDVKYAVVRVQGEQRMIDLFTLLVNNGYTDVSFVSSLAHTILNTETTASQVSEEASTSRVSSSSAASAAHVSTTTAVVQPQQQQQQPPPTTPVQQKQQGMSTPKQSSPQRDSSFSSPLPANAADLLQSLFERSTELQEDHMAYGAHHQPWVLPSGEIPSSPTSSVRPMIEGMSTGPQKAAVVGGAAPPEFAGASAVQLVRSMNYNGVDGAGRKMPYIVRMKGWQRRMLTDAMATGRLPTGAELTALCARSQVTETQALRFFRKRKFTDNYGQTAGGGPYQMDDDDDGMRGDSPEILQQEPKDELE